MKQTYIVIEDKDPIKYSFFKNFSKEVYNNFQQIKNSTPDDKIIVIFSHSLDVESIKRRMKRIEEKIKTNNIYFFIHNKIKMSFENNNNLIFFPININELKSLIKKENTQPINYNNVQLINNLLKNHKKDLFIKVSDIEKEILKLLFFHGTIEKEVIKVSVLNYKSEIKSNSVDSHLTRIRNKIETICANFKIVTSAKGTVSIRKIPNEEY